MTASGETCPAVALAATGNIKARGVSRCHLRDLMLHEAREHRVSAWAYERREARCQCAQRRGEDIRQQHVRAGRERSGARMHLQPCLYFVDAGVLQGGGERLRVDIKG